MIYVLSSGRHRPQFHHTLAALRSLAPNYWKETFLVVPDGQESQYREVERYFDVQMLYCPEQGIGKTRQWLMEQGDDVVAMIDDDMSFYRRVSMDEDDLRLRDLEVGELDECLSRMFGWIGELAHVSMAVRNTVQGIGDRKYLECSRANNLHVVHCPTLAELGVRWDVLEVMEDFYVTLSLLTRGYPNRVMTEFMWNQRGSGKVGGCSQYRTGEMQDRSARRLAQLFPKYVKLREKTSSSAWEGMQTRTDVVIQWKKAFNDA